MECGPVRVDESSKDPLDWHDPTSSYLDSAGHDGCRCSSLMFAIESLVTVDTTSNELNDHQTHGGPKVEAT
jgi:hypothetical protein